MRIIRYKIVSEGSKDHNIITQSDVNQLKKTRFEVVLFNKSLENPYRIVVLVDAREKYLKANLEDNPVETKKYIARRTIELLQKKGLNISSML